MKRLAFALLVTSIVVLIVLIGINIAALLLGPGFDP